MKVAPSLLAANFTDLKNEVKKIENADFLHLDIMDGHFVPNISFGPAIVASLRPLTELTFDVHLMISHPLKYIEEFSKAGADIISFHVECDDDADEVIEKLIALGVKPAIVVKPNTPIETIYKYAEKLYMVLIMTVEPGFGGQSFMPEQLEKATKLKEKFPNVLVQVDGGIGRNNVKQCETAGVDIVVAGTSVFKAENPKEEIEILRKCE